jgi:hypothetical protein
VNIITRYIVFNDDPSESNGAMFQLLRRVGGGVDRPGKRLNCRHGAGLVWIFVVGGFGGKSASGIVAEVRAGDNAASQRLHEPY